MGLTVGVVVIFLVCGLVTSFKEPHCSSFHYEEQLLEKTIRTGIKMEDVIKTTFAIEQRVNNTLEKITESLEAVKRHSNEIRISSSTAPYNRGK